MRLGFVECQPSGSCPSLSCRAERRSHSRTPWHWQAPAAIALTSPQTSKLCILTCPFRQDIHCCSCDPSSCRPWYRLSLAHQSIRSLHHSRTGLRVLVCAPSNVAVDNITGQSFTSAPCAASISSIISAAKLRVAKVPCVRLGHPARLLPQVLECRYVCSPLFASRRLLT